MCAFSRKMKKSTPLWCEDCRFVSFETGLEKPMLTLNDPNGLKNTTNVYSIHFELRMASPCQISTGKWKYVNPCLDFLGVPDQRTAYVKRQARPRWTYVRRSSVTPDLVMCWCFQVTRQYQNNFTYIFCAFPVELPSHECHETSMTIDPHGLGNVLVLSGNKPMCLQPVFTKFYDVIWRH